MIIDTPWGPFDLMAIAIVAGAWGAVFALTFALSRIERFLVGCFGERGLDAWYIGLVATVTLILLAAIGFSKGAGG